MTGRKKQILLSLLVLSMLYVLTCKYEHGEIVGTPCKEIEDAPLKQLTDANRKTFFEDPGIIAVYNGWGCAESNKDGKEDIIKVEESIDTPGYANAAVFLNGWRLKYLHGKHKVLGLATLIRNIQSDREHLKWEATGILSDKNFDDGYNWCYYYTVVAWNPSSLNLAIDQNDGACSYIPDETRDANYFFARNKEATTALSSFPTFLENPAFASSGKVAILPRGFGFSWGQDDHNLLQVAYHLDHSEISMRKQKKYEKGLGDTTRGDESIVDLGYVSWETSSIFKDDDYKRNYAFGEMVSGLGGTDVNVIQPPFHILPQEDMGFFGACLEPLASQTEDFKIDNIPYKYVIPMLAHWDLVYGCNDEEIQETGVWIEDMTYDPVNPGTLRYKLSASPHSEHAVTLLGIRPAVPAPTPSQKAADLIPFSPNGTDPTAFCRIEQNGKLLRVTIKNQGNDNAGGSKATVTFGTESVAHDVSPIAVGGSIDVLFEVPASCFHPDCSFKISVDSNNQVNELNEGNNSVSGGCIG